MAMVLQSTGIPKDVYSIMAARVLQSQASGGAVPSRLMQGGRSAKALIGSTLLV